MRYVYIPHNKSVIILQYSIRVYSKSTLGMKHASVNSFTIVFNFLIGYSRRSRSCWTFWWQGIATHIFALNTHINQRYLTRLFYNKIKQDKFLTIFSHILPLVCFHVGRAWYLRTCGCLWRPGTHWTSWTFWCTWP